MPTATGPAFIHTPTSYLFDHAHTLGDHSHHDALEDVHEGLVGLRLLDREGVEHVAARRGDEDAQVGRLVVRGRQPGVRFRKLRSEFGWFRLVCLVWFGSVLVRFRFGFDSFDSFGWIRSDSVYIGPRRVCSSTVSFGFCPEYREQVVEHRDATTPAKSPPRPAHRCAR